jgi:hypothetical protein
VRNRINVMKRNPRNAFITVFRGFLFWREKI